MHELSVSDGKAHFADAYVRPDGQVDAWHKLGTPVGHVMTGQEALEAAYMANWKVRKQKIYTQAGGKRLVIPRQFATVFDNPITNKVTPIGVVGERYTPIQNEELSQFGDAVIDEIGMQNYVCAGSLFDYSLTFLVIKLPATMEFEKHDKKDVTDWYLVLFNSHDGSSSMFGIITNIRVVCANTARVAIHGAKSKFTIRHTSGWRSYAQQAREALGLSWKYNEAFEEEARRLYETEFDVEQAKLFTEQLVDLHSTPLHRVDQPSVSRTKRQNEANHILKLFVESPTIVGTPIENTKWGAFNAVSEYVDHFANVRTSSRSAGLTEDVLRANRTLQLAAVGGGLKDDAWKILTAN